MIIVVGDLHGDWGSLNKLLSNKQPETVLQCGDFGWWPKMEIKNPVLYGHQKQWELKGVKPGNSKVYWCDGNHEDYSVLVQNEMITEKYPNVFHASRGSTLTLPDGRVVLFAGGASSVDKDMRVPGWDWFPEESIKGKELKFMLSHKKVDIVVSHTCPTSFLLAMRNDDRGNPAKFDDPSCKALEAVLDYYKPSLWFFGHLHLNREGLNKNCHWTCLDYPRHRSKWWQWLK